MAIFPELLESSGIFLAMEKLLVQSSLKVGVACGVAQSVFQVRILDAIGSPVR